MLFLIDGDLVLPRHVAALRKRGVEVRSCFVGRSNPVASDILGREGRGNWFETLDEAGRTATLREIATRSRHLQRECDRHDIPFFDVSTLAFREVQNRALNVLLEDR